MYLGEGTYGVVKAKKGRAIKSFHKLSHLLQEYLVLRYLRNCNNIVKPLKVDLKRRKLYMELCDCSLSNWIYSTRNSEISSESGFNLILRDIILGLIEIHDRGLAHGDIKPGNILIKKNIEKGGSGVHLKTVIGDCGFVSLEEFSKVGRTASPYRDTEVVGHWTHDIFSFGVCLIEIFTETKVRKRSTFPQLQKIIHDHIKDPSLASFLESLVHSDRKLRPSARDILKRMFPNEKLPPHPSSPSSRSIMKLEDCEDPELKIELKKIEGIMKETCERNNVYCFRNGYDGLVHLILKKFSSGFKNKKKKKVVKQIKLYSGCIIMILSAVFGKSGFDKKKVMRYTDNKCPMEQIYDTLDKLIHDDSFVKILLTKK